MNLLFSFQYLFLIISCFLLSFSFVVFLFVDYPFIAAIQAGVGAIMCSYNRINGTYACENSKALADLKTKMGFQVHNLYLSQLPLFLSSSLAPASSLLSPPSPAHVKYRDGSCPTGEQLTVQNLLL